MILYSTNNKSSRVSLKDAVLKGFPVDGGLYMPLDIPFLPSDFINNIASFSFQDISFFIANSLIGQDIPKTDLELIISTVCYLPLSSCCLK